MKMLSSPVLWIAVAIAAIAAVIWVLRSRTGSEWGFRDIVKNPKLWSNIQEAGRAVDREVEEAKQWNESQISAAVNRFIFDVASSQEASGDAKVLESLGPRVHPTVMQILSDASRRAKLIVATGKDLLPEAPFNRACRLLGDTPPTNAAVRIAPFLDEPATGIRKDAALVLGKIGTTEVVAPLRKAFADSDEYVRSYGLMGLQWAILRSWSGPGRTATSQLLCSSTLTRHVPPNYSYRREYSPRVRRLSTRLWKLWPTNAYPFLAIDC